MQQYDANDFEKSEAWLIFRLDTKTTSGPVDIYTLMHLPSELILGHEVVDGYLSLEQASHLLQDGKNQSRRIPYRILLASNDPAEPFIRSAANTLPMKVEPVSEYYFENLLAPIKHSFGKHFLSPAAMSCEDSRSHTTVNDRGRGTDCTKKMIPDSDDFCYCASYKMYKFCCKKILTETVKAMAEAEAGHHEEALQWIEKAKLIVGETAEVLCRKAIVYSFVDEDKSTALIKQCLKVNPHHPRAHYIKGIDLKSKNDLQGAIKSYQTAILNYPKTAYFHLNEVYNNLGTAYYDAGDWVQAKSAWETALLYMPSDATTRHNLQEFIYNKQKSAQLSMCVS